MLNRLLHFSNPDKPVAVHAFPMRMLPYLSAVEILLASYVN